MAQTILIVADEGGEGQALAGAVTGLGFEVRTAAPDAAVEHHFADAAQAPELMLLALAPADGALVDPAISPAMPWAAVLEAVARDDAVVRALARADGNVSEAARALGVGRATLYRRMKRLGIGE